MNELNCTIYNYFKLKKFSVSVCRDVWVITKSHYNDKTKVLTIYKDTNDTIRIKYNDGKEEVCNIDEFISHLKKEIDSIKLYKKWYSSNKPKKKMSYVHNKITDFGLDYVKSKSGINFNMNI